MANKMNQRSNLCLLLIFFIGWLPLLGYSETISANNIEDLTASISNYIDGKGKAKIGVAVMTDKGDTVKINGNEPFPMLSVYKFPQALAVAEYCMRNGVRFSDTINISKNEILIDTYSPLREIYGVNDVALPISELLAFTLQQSDNNACDILFRLIGGVSTADAYLKSNGFYGIHLASTEEEMHRDTELCYANSATPMEMVKLISFFDNKLRCASPEYKFISEQMETCSTGTDRLAAPLNLNKDIIGHKTGTGDKNKSGQIIGVNDVGYIKLVQGGKYYIVVFVSDSGYDYQETSQIIADISEIVLDWFNNK